MAIPRNMAHPPGQPDWGRTKEGAATPPTSIGQTEEQPEDGGTVSTEPPVISEGHGEPEDGGADDSELD